MNTEQLAREAPIAALELQPAEPTPAMWIGTSADYAGDRLHGGWVEAARPIREVMAGIGDVIDRTPDALGQRWDIQELRGFGIWHRTRDEGLDTVLEVARGVGLYGPAYSGLISRVGAGSLAAAIDRFPQTYVGSWPSEEAFADQLITDSDWHEQIRRLPTEMQSFIRFDARKLMRAVKRDLTVVRHAGGIWVYDPRWW